MSRPKQEKYRETEKGKATARKVQGWLIMSDLIKRYKIVMFENNWMREVSPDGDYVMYEDHATRIAELEAQLKATEANEQVLVDANKPLLVRIAELEAALQEVSDG